MPPRTHGHSGLKKTGTYNSWSAMIQRCTNPNSPVYSFYGGRGISVCQRWRRFDNFLMDMGERPKGKTLDRKNNQGNYEPENCRWITMWEQCRNFRRNVWITVGNETMILQDWADKLGVHEENLRRWYHAGIWPKDFNHRPAFIKTK
jgi:hypothetical protein